MSDRSARAFAATIPDGDDRGSYVRVRAHNAPLSSDLSRLADAVDTQVLDIVETLESCSGARLLQMVEGLIASQRMFAQQLRKHSKTAASHETELAEKMRQVREILEARHG